MSISDSNDNMFSSGEGRYSEGLTLESIITSDQWVRYLTELSRTLGLELGIYDDFDEQLLLLNENPFCKVNRSKNGGAADCPGSCNSHMKSREHSLFQCRSNMTCFSFPVEREGEKAYVVGRGGFSSYRDLQAFLKAARENNLPEVPLSKPLEFVDTDYMKSTSRYLSMTVSRQLNNFAEKYELEEKYMRIPSLFDGQAFGTLSKKPELMYRYILDTIEFVFGSITAVMLVKDDATAYNPVYAVGKNMDAAMNFSIEADSRIIKEIKSGKSVLSGSINEMIDEKKGVFNRYCFIPIFAGGGLAAVIGLLDVEMAREDIKILKAFREYVQLNLDSINQRGAETKGEKKDSKLTYLADVTKTVNSISDKERLLNTMLEKSLQLINAEQGSLMLLDDETSELVVEARKSIDDTVQEKMRFKKSEGISGMVLESGGPMLVRDIEKDPRVRQINRDRYRTKSFVSVPIKIEDRMAGVLNLSDKLENDSFDRDDLRLIEAFVSNVAIAIERSLLYKQRETLQKLSITDPLTGIYNRRYLNKRLSEEITRYNRYKHPFSFMMLDLDKFKEYNDTFGHIAGDNLIKTLANIMEKSLRTIDIAARFGGDEFVAIFPQTPKVDAIQISNRLKEQIEESLKEHNLEMPLKISVGLATFPDDASSIMELIEKTDQALYLAKKGGGNRVVYL